MNKKSLVLILALVLAPAIAAAQAQFTTGIIEGTVYDPSGAVVPGVEVTARNVDTNFTRTMFTDGEGRFSLLQMPTGPYEVTYALTGFATLVQDGLSLTVGQTLTLRPALMLSTARETITVTGSDIIDTRATPSSTTLDQLTVETTPNLGRKFEDLLTLTPGVAIVQGPDGDEISFAGQRGIFNNISLDGGDYNNGFFGEQVGGQRAAVDITLEAVKEFQVVATGANAEFGRTAGGVVNVISKSGTNETHGSAFFYGRNEALTGDLSDGTRLEDFHREQWGGTLGGPIRKDRLFYFFAVEGITGDFTRPNLSVPIGEPCPVSNPTVPANEDLINSSADCQRVALLNFLQTSLGVDDGRPIAHPVETLATLLKVDWNINDSNTLAVSWNFNHSRKENETFDVSTFGNSANGIEGDPARINVLNANLFSTISPTKLNEFHFTYSREVRPRTAAGSGLTADTGIGFSPSFRFGDPFFLQPNVDETFWRAQLRDTFTVVKGEHTIKLGGEWIHSLNDQVFRGFFTGRYLFASATGFLRYASPAAPGGFGPNTISCTDGSYVTAPATCPPGSAFSGGPLLLYLQDVGTGFANVPPPGASVISNNEFGFFVQDTWKVRPNLTLNFGLRWDAQTMPETVDPQTTAYAQFIGDPDFPSDGTIPDQWDMWQPRLGFAWDVTNDAKTVVRGNFGIYNPRQNMLSQVGSVTTNGLQQRTEFRSSELATFGVPMPTWPGVFEATPNPPGVFPDFTGIRAFDKDYKNPRITTWNVAVEREIIADVAAYADFTWSKGENLTRFLQINREPGECCDLGPGTGNTVAYGPGPFGPALGDVFITNSLGRSEYRGLTLGVRKRFSNGFQFDANYVYSTDKDTDSNERDPFTDRSYDISDLEKDFGYSDRDIRHRFNLFAFANVGPLNLNVRWQVRSAQPITAVPRVLNGVDRGRNGERKDNEYNSFDWRLSWPIRLGSDKQLRLVPIIEMFNTFNSKNRINPLSTDLLFNFDGFLRTGVGDPRQLQYALRFEF
jgi:hypothetical protein